jgi:hypothetical protein
VVWCVGTHKTQQKRGVSEHKTRPYPAPLIIGEQFEHQKQVPHINAKAMHQIRNGERVGVLFGLTLVLLFKPSSKLWDHLHIDTVQTEQTKRMNDQSDTTSEDITHKHKPL